MESVETSHGNKMKDVVHDERKQKNDKDTLLLYLFRCVLASLYEGMSVRPLVCPSVGPSVRGSVRMSVSIKAKTPKLTKIIMK